MLATSWTLIVACLLATGCALPAEDEVAGDDRPAEGVVKSAALVRAERRAFDGAPPVPPHEDFGITCTECHDEIGIEVPDIGYAPPTPHTNTRGMSDESRCRQCHVFAESDTVFVASRFVGLPQDLRRGRRLNPLSPPVIPHGTFMRETCAACHTGPAAREEIRTSHPERIRCRQCHVPSVTASVFPAASGGAGRLP